MPIFAMSKEKRKKIVGLCSWRPYVLTNLKRKIMNCVYEKGCIVEEINIRKKSRRAKRSPTQRNETTDTKWEREFLQRAKLSCLLGGKIGQ